MYVHRIHDLFLTFFLNLAKMVSYCTCFKATFQEIFCRVKVWDGVYINKKWNGFIEGDKIGGLKTFMKYGSSNKKNVRNMVVKSPRSQTLRQSKDHNFVQKANISQTRSLVLKNFNYLKKFPALFQLAPCSKRKIIFQMENCCHICFSFLECD